MTNAQTISQLKTAADAAKNHIDVTAIKEAEAQSDYDEAVGGGDDDFLSDLEDVLSTATGLHKRAIKRHAALVAQLANAESLARVEDGKAHNAAADALLADTPALMAEAMQHAEQIALIAQKMHDAIKASEPERRLAHHHGVTPTPATLSTPDIGPALEGLRLLSRLPGVIWKPLYV